MENVILPAQLCLFITITLASYNTKTFLYIIWYKTGLKNATPANQFFRLQNFLYEHFIWCSKKLFDIYSIITFNILVNF